MAPNSYELVRPEQYALNWRPLQERIFLDNPHPSTNPFRNKAWGTLLLTGGFFLDDLEVEALLAGISEAGDEWVAMHEISRTLEETEGIALRPTPEAWDRLTRDLGPLLVADVTGLFGQSASWGTAFFNEDFAWVGGEARFTSAVLTVLGGGTAARVQFEQFAKDFWTYMPEDKKEALIRSPSWASSNNEE